ncbi:MAG: polyketide cyclase [Verrucomicrobiales bacterium]|nr:polyketide cyclase [Verrucomicrobiales bacterium]
MWGGLLVEATPLHAAPENINAMSTEPKETDITAWLNSTERQVLRLGLNKSALLRCRLEASPERVWAACTDRSQLRQWFADVKGDLHDGATLAIDVGAPCELTSRILQCEPSRRLRFSWSYPGRGIDEVEVRLAANGEGTLLELEHRSDDETDWWFGAGSGWEIALIRLTLLLRGDNPSGIATEKLDQKLGQLWTIAGRACA